MIAYRLRHTIAVSFAAALLLAVAGPTSAGYPEDWEPLVFEITLAGDVNAEDSFGIAHSCADGEEQPECIFIEPYRLFCSSDQQVREDWRLPECVAGTFRVELERAVGVTVDYSLVRLTRTSDSELHLTDSVTVPEGGIRIHLGYNYSVSATATAPIGGPTLPDTAAELTPSSVSESVGLWSMAAVFLLAVVGVVRRRSRVR